MILQTSGYSIRIDVYIHVAGQLAVVVYTDHPMVGAVSACMCVGCRT